MVYRIVKRIENTNIGFLWELAKLTPDWCLHRTHYFFYSQKPAAELRSCCFGCQFYHHAVSDKIFTHKMCNLQPTSFPTKLSFKLKSYEILSCRARRLTGMSLELMTNKQLLNICYMFIKSFNYRHHHKK